MKLVPRLVCVFSFIFIVSLNAFAGDAPPSWMKQAASVSLPAYDKEVTAVVLYNEQQVTLNGDGVLVTTENYAVKILSREGRKHAIATALYLMSSGKVRDIEGWLIRPDGTTKNYDKKSVLDIISNPDDVYNEYRLKVIDGSNDVDAGFVFGYTAVSEDKPLYFQEKWFSQDNLPSLVSRYTLNLPVGWKASGITFNYPPMTPQINGTSYTWELKNLPYIKAEPMSPSVRNLVPWVAINYSPENPSQAIGKAFSNWVEVSRWATGLFDTQVIVDDAVAAKAQELTVNAKTELEKIRAISAYVQNLQYISIDIGVGHGNGYRPRPSNLVLSRGYGDCKDKANLMRALLKALKIEAYPVAIFSGDRTFVREEWATPGQFNHCVIAVKVSDTTESPTIIKHAALGRLLIFDATDQFTPLGDLPNSLQGSFGLIIAGDNGTLTRMPVIPPEFNTWKRKVEVNLSEDGSIKGVIRERANGQLSTYARATYRSLSANDFNKAIEAWLTRGATGAKLVKMTPEDKQSEASFNLDIEFSASLYGQLMQNRLLVFKPAIVNRANSIYLTEKTRQYPIVFDSDSFEETTVFNLPKGFVVDEMPDAMNMETPFGKYTTSYKVEDGKLYYTRLLIVNRTTVSVDKYNSVRDFYAKMRDAEQSPVVLLRK